MIRRRYHALLVVTLLAFGLTVVGMTPGAVRASTISRYSQGFSGVVTGTGVWLWSGTVLAGEQANMTASGDQNNTGGVNVGWSCQGYGNVYGQDWLGSRAWVIAPGPLASATIAPIDQSRYCSFYMQPDTPAPDSRINVYSSQVRLDHDVNYVPPPPVPPPGPTATPTSTPVPTATPSFYTNPSSSPSPSPSDPCAQIGYETVPAGMHKCTVALTVAGAYPSGAVLRISWATQWSQSHGGTSKSMWSCLFLGAYDAAKVAASSYGTCATGYISIGGGSMGSDTTDGTSGTANQTFDYTVPIDGLDGLWVEAYPSDGGAPWNTAGGSYIHIDSATATPHPTATPSGSPSPAPSGSGALAGAQCLRSLPNGTTESYPCPKGTGVPGAPTADGNNPGCDIVAFLTGTTCYDNSFGGPGTTAGAPQCVPGPLTGICKPGMGVYGQGADCPFPGLSLNPLDYLGWIGCVATQIVTGITNLPRYVINALLDIIFPAPGIGTRIGGHLTALEGVPPFAYIGELISQVSGASGASAMSIPDIPLPGGAHVSFPIAEMATGMSGVRTVLVGFVWLSAALSIIRIVAGSFGTGNAGGDE